MKNRLHSLLLKHFCLSMLTATLFTGLPASAQTTRKITGKITTETNAPLQGATITVKKTNRSVVSSESGTFALDVQPGDTLHITLVGYEPRNFPVGLQTDITITLKQSTVSLNDVIIVGYGTQRKKSVTGAISAINATDLQRTPAVTTSGALVGKVQGITARAGDARPGNGTALQIRNMGTPLYVIDGIPSDEGTFNQLGLNDIESISILKDAAAAIYGLRASNGVILITTKKGKAKEKPSVNLSGYYGLQNYTRYPKPANAYQYMRGLAESEQNYNATTRTITAETLDKWKQGTEKGYQSFDYYDFIMRPNVPQYYLNASASGGSDRMNYYLSVGHLKQDALIKDFRFNRTNLQANIDAGLSKGLKVGTQISARIEDRHQVGVPGLDDYFNPFLSIFSMWPTERPYANDNPNYINQTHNVNVNPATYTEAITGYSNNVWRSFRSNLYAEYNFGFGLSAKGTYSYGYTFNNFDGFEYTYDAYNYDPATDQYNVVNGGGNQNPWRQKSRTNIKERIGQFQLNYNKQFGQHSLSALLGYERSDREYTFLLVQTVPPNNYIPIQYFTNQTGLTDEYDIQARAGYIGRVNYNYKQKYLIEFLSRYDGSYLFPKDHRYGFFPGVSAGWRISDEPFLKNNTGDWLTDVKIRASYGQTGSDYLNDASIVSPFSYLGGATYGSGNAVLDGTLITGVQPRGLPVTNLSWVKSISKNIGVDFTLFNKFSGTIDLFERKRTGLPAARYDVLLPNEVGYSLPNENLNSDVTRGIEGMLSYRAQQGNVTWSLSVNATIGRLRSLHTYKPRFGNSWDEYRTSIENRWSDITWGYHVIGRFQSQQDVDSYGVNNDGQNNRTELPGDFKYQDVNGDKIINSMDERPIGYAQGALPYMSFGINGSTSWKGFTLQFDFAGATMQSFQRDWELRYPFQNNGNSPDYMLEDRWHRADPFDNSSEWIPGKYPAIRKDNSSHANYKLSDFWLTNVHYIRLKNLVLGYSFPEKMVQKWGISALRVYVNGTNLFSFDNLKEYGIDPEITATNGLVYPQQRLYNFGFNVTL